MVKKNSYTDLKIKFPDYIIIQKAGFFYDVRDFGAIFFSQHFGYSLYSDNASEYKIGIPRKRIKEAMEVLETSNYKYVLTEHYEIIEQYDNGISIPLIESKNKENIKAPPKTIIKIKTILSKNASKELFKELKKYCNDKAALLNIPNYYVCENKCLDALIQELPKSIEELYLVPGFKNARVEKYGQDFINIINNFLQTTSDYEEIEVVETIDDKKTNSIKSKINAQSNKLEEPDQILDAQYANKLKELIRDYRTEKAREGKIPVYCIFSDKTMLDIVKYLPLTIDDFMKINGFKQVKCEKYGNDIINIISNFINTNPTFIKNNALKEENLDILKIEEDTKLWNLLNSLSSEFNKNNKLFELKEALLSQVYCDLKSRCETSDILQSGQKYSDFKEGFILKEKIYLNDDDLNIINEVYLILKDKCNRCMSKSCMGCCWDYSLSIINSLINNYEPILPLETKPNDEIPVEPKIETILNCIQEFDGKYSYKGIIKILTGYLGFQFIPRMRKSEFYGIYKGVDHSEIASVLDYLISKDIIVDDYKIKIKREYQPFGLTREGHEQNLNKIFGHQNFRDWQWNIIKNLLNKKRVLSIEKTGGGKSLCFQYTAQYLYSMGKGVTIVFSPLQALMREQVEYLKSLGISAECIISPQNSTPETLQEHKTIYDRLVKNKVSILYIAPERLSNSMWLKYSSKFKIAMVVIDEAHCISTWGHDFRIDYRRIIELTKLLPPNIPVLGLTATANDIVANDIQEQIGKDLQIIRGSLERQNLHLNVIKTGNLNEKFIYMKNYINMQDGHGIVYVATQADTKIFSDWLNFVGIKSTYYHAGLSDEKRQEIEFALKNDVYKVIVSTNALGMGMDKKDVRFVLHSQMPSSLIAYYQEIGRAGRDNLPSDILLLYNDDDEDLQKYFIDTSKPSMKHYVDTLKYIKNNNIGMYDLIKLVNVRKPTMKLILKDLEDKGHIKRLENYKYNFIKDMSDEEFDLINKYKEIRYDDLAKMLQYIHLEDCRTKFISHYLNDNSASKCGHCDCCTKPLNIDLSEQDFELLKEFFANYFIYDKNECCEMVSSGYYKIDDVGKLVKDSKYRNRGYFHEHLLNRVIRAYQKYYKDKNFDSILFVPPTVSGDLVEEFANRVAKILQIPVRNDLIKTKKIDTPLKQVKSKLKKRELLKGVFELKNSDNYIGAKILLIDDIIDSGVTVEEISKTLRSRGVVEVCVLTIAKTNVGDE